MKNRSPISLFPFLSVLLSTMGVLSFLAITFMMFARPEAAVEEKPEPVQVSWLGAPAHVRPLLVECRAEAIVLHTRPGGAKLSFARRDLIREVEIVGEMLAEANRELGEAPPPTQLWLYLKRAIQNDPRLVGSFTRSIHDIEIGNLRGESHKGQVQRYPILLVYPDGIETYELASYLVETTTRLALGLEPMLKDWVLPYRDITS